MGTPLGKLVPGSRPFTYRAWSGNPAAPGKTFSIPAVSSKMTLQNLTFPINVGHLLAGSELRCYVDKVASTMSAEETLVFSFATGFLCTDTQQSGWVGGYCGPHGREAPAPEVSGGPWNGNMLIPTGLCPGAWSSKAPQCPYTEQVPAWDLLGVWVGTIEIVDGKPTMGTPTMIVAGNEFNALQYEVTEMVSKNGVKTHRFKFSLAQYAGSSSDVASPSCQRGTQICMLGTNLMVRPATNLVLVIEEKPTMTITDAIGAICGVLGTLLALHTTLKGAGVYDPLGVLDNHVLPRLRPYFGFLREEENETSLPYTNSLEKPLNPEGSGTEMNECMRS